MTEPPNWIDLTLLKETYISAATAVDKMKEPTNNFTLIHSALQEALFTDRVGNDPAFATFIYEDLGPGIAKRLNKERSNDETVRPRSNRYSTSG
jgi:hypothetical protein